jgi:amino acid transporter
MFVLCTSRFRSADKIVLISLNVSTKGFALVGAALLLLDFASTSIVSAATAATYLGGEVSSLPFPVWVGAIIILVLFTLVSLIGVRENARLTLAVLSLHVSDNYTS